MHMFIFIQTGSPCKWTNDSKHLLLEHFDTIHNSPSQLYHLALPLLPPSWLHRCYSAELSFKVKVVKGPTEWGACSHTISMDSDPVILLHWNGTIAVGSTSEDIIILDAITGRQIAVLSGHTEGVWSVKFSSDGRSLVSPGAMSYFSTENMLILC